MSFACYFSLFCIVNFNRLKVSDGQKTGAQHQRFKFRAKMVGHDFIPLSAYRGTDRDASNQPVACMKSMSLSPRPGHRWFGQSYGDYKRLT
jgi:hypothetical protein